MRTSCRAGPAGPNKAKKVVIVASPWPFRVTTGIPRRWVFFCWSADPALCVGSVLRSVVLDSLHSCSGRAGVGVYPAVSDLKLLIVPWRRVQLSASLLQSRGGPKRRGSNRVQLASGKCYKLGGLQRSKRWGETIKWTPMVGQLVSCGRLCSLFPCWLHLQCPIYFLFSSLQTFAAVILDAHKVQMPQRDRQPPTGT